MSTHYQGKIVVERDGEAYVVMFPDGNVRAFGTYQQAEAAISLWAKAHTAAEINTLVVEWR
jgi:hypothetical protein